MLLFWHGTKPRGPEGAGDKGSELSDMVVSSGGNQLTKRDVSLSFFTLKKLFTFLERVGSKEYRFTAHLACESGGLIMFVNQPLAAVASNNYVPASFSL